MEQGVIMSKRAVLMMTFGSPEDITYEGVAEFFTNIRRGVRPEPHEIQTLYDHDKLPLAYVGNYTKG